MRDEVVERDRSQYRHRSEYVVRYDDLDTYRHVNNKSFLTFVEDARVRYLRDVMGFRHHADSGTGVMVVHSRIDYVDQIHAFEAVTVWTRCARLGRSSVELHHLVEAGVDSRDAVREEAAARDESAAHDESPAVDTSAARRLCATSVTVLATMDIKKNASTPTEPSVVEAIKAWEPMAPST